VINRATVQPLEINEQKKKKMKMKRRKRRTRRGSWMMNSE